MWGSTPLDDDRKGFRPMLVVMGAWFWEEPQKKPTERPAGKPNYDKRRKPRY